MTNGLQPYQSNPLEKYTEGAAGYRVQAFIRWAGDDWWQPDLEGYAHHLLTERGLTKSTAAQYLGSVKTAYAHLLKDNKLRRWIIEHAQGETLAERQAYYFEWRDQLTNSLDEISIKVPRVRDQDERKFKRLTQKQVEALLHEPGTDTLMGIRDTAILALLFCTGVRREELCNLEVRDLRAYKGDELSLHIREGKGNVARLVPYGDLVWCLEIVDEWLRRAEITEGFVFRGLYKNERLRPGGLRFTSMNKLLERYGLSPHNARRTYARRMYDAGMDIVAIRDNLGHSLIETTERYIGGLDASARRGRLAYSFKWEE